MQLTIKDWFLSKNKVINGDERPKEEGTLVFRLGSRDTRSPVQGNQLKRYKMTLQCDSQFPHEITPKYALKDG